LVDLANDAGSILDRFLHHADIISITGKNYRIAHRRSGGEELEDVKTKD